MRTSMLLLVAIVILNVSMTDGKKDRNRCRHLSRKVSKCIRKGYEPRMLAQEMLEGCKINPKDLKKNVAMKCAMQEKRLSLNTCSPLCNKGKTTPPDNCPQKTVQQCTSQPGQVFYRGMMLPIFYTGISTMEACVEKCRNVAGCVAVIHVPKQARCFTKNERHNPLSPDIHPSRTAYSLEMSCLEECQN